MLATLNNEGRYFYRDGKESLFFIGNLRALPCKKYAYDKRHKNYRLNARPQKSSDFTPRIRLKGGSCHRAALPCKRWHQVSFFMVNATKEADNVVDRTKQYIDNVQKAERRMGALCHRGAGIWNLRHNNKRLDRFTLRGKAKVDAQWKLFCLVHNIEKRAHYD